MFRFLNIFFSWTSWTENIEAIVLQNCHICWIGALCENRHKNRRHLTRDSICLVLEVWWCRGIRRDVIDSFWDRWIPQLLLDGDYSSLDGRLKHSRQYKLKHFLFDFFWKVLSSNRKISTLILSINPRDRIMCYLSVFNLVNHS